MRQLTLTLTLTLTLPLPLTRCVLKNSLRQLHQAGWPAGGAESFAEILRLGPFSRYATRGPSNSRLADP